MAGKLLQLYKPYPRASENPDLLSRWHLFVAGYIKSATMRDILKLRRYVNSIIIIQYYEEQMRTYKWNICPEVRDETASNLSSPFELSLIMTSL